MRAQSWIALFRHIPPEKQSLFTIITANGTEFTIQNFIRIEPEMLIVKGRLAASQDAGRVFFVPYSQIDSFSYTNPVRESDVDELFGGFVFPEAAAAPHLPHEQPAPARPSMLGVPAPAGASPQGSILRPAIRSEVLERFRSSRPGSSLNLPRPGEANGHG